MIPDIEMTDVHLTLLFSTNLLNCMCMHKGDILLYESDI